MDHEGDVKTGSQDTASSHPTKGANGESDGSWRQPGHIAEMEEESNSPSATYTEQLLAILLKLTIGEHVCALFCQQVTVIISS